MVEPTPATVRPLIEIIGPGSKVPEEADWLDTIRKGRVVVVKNALQRLNCLDQVAQLTLDAIRENASAEQAREVEVQGFERLHLCLTGDQIYSVYRSLTDSLRGLHHRIVTRFLSEIANYKGRLYVSDKIWVRFFVPHDQYLENRALFSTRVGHLRTQNPHRDSWITTPSNALVLWLAIGRVVPGNSMLFYPDYWDRAVDHRDYEKRNLRIDTDIHLGVPVNVALEPGDALLFSGEHLHSSEVNVTDETRFALSFRFTMRPPRYGEGNRWYPYLNADWLDGLLAPLAGVRSRFCLTYLRYLLFWRLGYWLRQRLLPNRTTTGITSPSQSAEAPAFQGERLPDLQIGEVRPLDASYAIARTSSGTFVFSRYCPHEGADLTTGYLRNGRIHCPWHNLGIDLQTGASQCRSLARLRVTRLEAP